MPGDYILSILLLLLVVICYSIYDVVKSLFFQFYCYYSRLTSNAYTAENTYPFNSIVITRLITGLLDTLLMFNFQFYCYYS